MFPQVAPKFFSTRAEGPKNVSKGVEPAPAKPADGQPKPGDGKRSITSPVTYEVQIGEKTHKVTVQPV